ncbi:ligase-associated DNA damage response endonuclease PdeM [Mucilaginibacter sp. HMF5004]|uniref:ligase-associated DNA damage response endonuclease PdeM n=1 Tax=Mucilaginibacter rivuli TaxID=2857527 RepID=UPI001C5EF9CF|nr:ligase-associated DNA damage response endonuclease PdeM [Mucilaginibacter rivuli]MBW4890452.1 ligase-associated DNA damage response endonuclease PdeM [Mucilaginibacter rivuli]
MACDDLAFNLLNQTLLLLCQKAIYWKEEKALIAADVHLGKGGHFRKAGIAIPRDLAQDDLAVLSDLIHSQKPEKLIFLGDLFHSDMNSDWDWFALWRQQFPELQIILIRGNHDVIHDEHYLQLNVELHASLVLGPFLMLHHPLPPEKLADTKEYVLCGHIHPGVLLRGKGRQSATLPCFAFGKMQGVLPSFGRFTGKISMYHEKNDTIFGVLADKVIKV